MPAGALIGAPATDVVGVDSAAAAIGVLRTVRVDLVAVGGAIEGVASPWEFVRKLRSAWPGQKWAFVADESGSGEGPDSSSDETAANGLSDRDELAARQLGAVAVLEGPDAWRHVAELAQKLRRARPQHAVPGLRLRVPVPAVTATAGA